ncbi:TPA: hypothetical protein ACH3X2_010122 [Trebouxia sp. C0005]
MACKVLGPSTIGYWRSRTNCHKSSCFGRTFPRRTVVGSSSHDQPATSQRSMDTLDLLLGSTDPSPEDTFDEVASASVADIVNDQAKAQTEQGAQTQGGVAEAASQQQADASTSAPGPEALLEAFLARKLTAKMLVDAGKGQAQKWINDKLTPKESLLASMGAENHDFMTKPFLSYGVLVVNLAVYAAGLGVRFSLGEASGEDYFYMLAKVNDEIVQGEYYRLVTSAFLHDSFSHLMLNTYALYTVAPEVEAVLGHWTFLSVYLLSGLAGSAAAFVFGDTITVGASTCIFGLIGALGGYMWKNRALNQSSETLVSIAGIAAFSLAMGWSNETTVGNLGHIIGGLTGMFLGWGIGPTLVEPTEQELQDQDNSKNQKAKIVTIQSQTFGDALSSSSGKPGKLRRKVEPLGGIRQVSISASLLAGLVGIVVTTVAQRVGHVPVARGLGL